METSTERSFSTAGSAAKRSQESDIDSSTASKRTKLDVNEAEHDVTTRRALSESAPDSSAVPQKSAANHTDKPKFKKGQRGDKIDRRRGTRREDAEPRNSEEPKGPRVPKRACALLMGFCGAGYSGMQFQPGQSVRTIEGVVFDALTRVGAVSQDNADDPRKVSVIRAARTDAGVHAAGNVVSMKLINSIPDLVARVNEELPPEIRIWSILRVQNTFNARLSCDSRKYTYYFPSYMMIPPKPGSGLHQNLQQNGTEPPAHPFWATGDPEADTSVDLRRKRDYRMPPDALESLRATACKFAGSHNFHNFTFGREFRDRSCFRFMKEISVADPVVFGDTEWVSVMFHGQSFMLHQIRKMMSALVLTCRTGSPPEIMDELYGPRMVFVPKMPALGLLLEYPIFETYKQKIAKFNEKLDPSETDYRLPIDFEAHREQLDKFKEKCIYPRMREIESEVGLFDSWMRSIDSYSGNDLLWLNSKGIVPGAAVIQKGVRRADPFKERKHFDSTGYPTTTAEKSMSVADEEAEEEEEALDKAKLEDMEG